MNLRAIPSFMAPSAVAEVDARLNAIRQDHKVTILLAIESGSRAWGFPSPDSDYDCRFLYLQRSGDYLALFPRRDVIETPLVGEMDVNGWDLAKALRLLLKGNAVVIEWLTSPIVYEGNPQFQNEMTQIAHSVADRELVARHYLHLGERQRRAYFADHKNIALKKIFYALRPATALRWLRFHPTDAVAPMHFPTLVKESEMPETVSNIVSQLIEQKSTTRELGRGPLPEVVAAFIDSEFEAAKGAFGTRRIATSSDRKEIVEKFFRAALARFSSC